MNATITNNSAGAIPITAWIGAMPTDDSLMLTAGNSVTFSNDQIGRVDCGVVPSNVTRMSDSLAAVDTTVAAFIQQAITWYNKAVSSLQPLTVTVQDNDLNHGIYCVVGTLANQQVVPVGHSLQLQAVRTAKVSLYIQLRPVGFDLFTGPRGGSIPV